MMDPTGSAETSVISYQYTMRKTPQKSVRRFSWAALPLKTEPIGLHETSVNNYQSTLRNIPEELRSQYIFMFQRGFFCKSRMVEEFRL